MTNSRLCSLDELLRRGNLAELLSGARERTALTAQIRALLPPAEAEQLVRAHRDADGQLILTVSSGSWAARLRYTTEALGEQRIRVRVAPGERST